jgi:hypothetical protein
MKPLEFTSLFGIVNRVTVGLTGEYRFTWKEASQNYHRPGALFFSAGFFYIRSAPFLRRGPFDIARTLS